MTCPLGWGSALRRLDQDRAARRPRAGCSRSSRPSDGDVTDVDEDPPPDPGRGLPAAAEALRPPVLARAPRRRHRAHPGARRPQHRALRPARRADAGSIDAGLRWTSRSPSRSTSARASPTRPARGAPSGRAYVHRLPPCGDALPRRRERAAVALPRRGGRLRGAPGGRSWRTTRCPAVMGRVCYHPCETACNRAQLDEAVGINSVERFLGDEAIKQGWTVAPPRRRPASACCRRRRAVGPVGRLPPAPPRPRGRRSATPARRPAA